MEFLDFILDIILIVVPFIIWYYKGNGNEVFPSTETSPPEGLLPSEAGYVLTGRVENSALGVMIISWASRGYLRINTKENFRLEKIRDIPYSSRKYEIYLFDRLFSRYGRDGILDWKKLSPFAMNRLKSAKLKIIRHFTTKAENRIFSSDGRPFAVIVGILATLPVAKLIFIELYVLRNSFRFGPGLTIIINALILTALYFISSILAKPDRLRSRHSWKFILTIFILITALAVGLTAFWVVGGGSGALRYVFSMISSFIIIIVLNLMTRRTSHGDHLYEQCSGFRNFILSAEPETIKQTMKGRPDMFTELYAHTAAMGISDSWAECFSSEPVDIPDWLICYGGPRINSHDFDKLMLGLIAQID